jgi:hypothetical protein
LRLLLFPIHTTVLPILALIIVDRLRAMRAHAVSITLLSHGKQF